MASCPVCGGSCRALRPPPPPRRRLRTWFGRLALRLGFLALLLALVLWATPAAAGPIFFAPLAHPEVQFVGGSWYPTAETFGVPWEDRWLGALVFMGGFTEPTLFQARYTLDGVLAGSVDWLLPPPWLEGVEFTALGIVLEFYVPAHINDYAVHRLVIDFTLPEDARHYELDVLQPVPEPGTLALLGSALAWLGWRVRRGR